MFRYDKSAKGIEWPLQVLNNLTGGEGLQTILGNGFSHIQNIGNKVEGVRYYQGRMIVRLKEHFLFQDKYEFDGISLGHYVTGENIAYSPTDKTGNIDLFAHEFAHTFQSRITGPGYLLKYGIPSGPLRSNVPEWDANYRAYKNLNIQPWDDPMEFNRTKWWEFFSFPFIWPFMWDWND